MHCWSDCMCTVAGNGLKHRQCHENTTAAQESATLEVKVSWANLSQKCRDGPDVLGGWSLTAVAMHLYCTSFACRLPNVIATNQDCQEPVFSHAFFEVCYAEVLDAIVAAISPGQFILQVPTPVFLLQWGKCFLSPWCSVVCFCSPSQVLVKLLLNPQVVCAEFLPSWVSTSGARVLLLMVRVHWK